MEKKLKILKTITIILLIIAISLISFIGIFRSKLNYKENIIAKFKYGMEIDGNREFRFKLDTSSEEKNIYVDENGNYKGTPTESEEKETLVSLESKSEEYTVAEEEVNKIPYNTEKRIVKANEDNVLNKDSYEKTKSIIQKRLNDAEIPEYYIRLNTITGELILEVPEDNYTQKAYNLALEQGKFEIIDSQTGVVLLDNSHLKKAQALYSANESYQVYLQIEFNDKGSEILKEISKEYTQTTDETGEVNTKNVDLKLDESTLLSTYFSDELDQGIIQITMGSSTTNYLTFMDNYNSAREFANIINYGKTPNKLSLASDNFVMSPITESTILYCKISFLVFIVIISILFIIKFKVDGVYATITSIGYIALNIIIIRYTNVTITLNSAFIFLAITVINYIFLFNFLNKKKTDSPRHAFKEVIKTLNIDLIPLWIVSIIFTFMTNITIGSVGMVLFWGLFLHFVYSYLITKNLFT
ncbi:MAG: hypothetical protein IKM97_01235 [Clostridia bacterium]|nr:hypothetical protein [Clostridia bacterium]